MTMRLQHLTLPAFEALIHGDVPAAERIVGLPIPAEFAAQLDIWASMITLLSGRPENHGWVMQAVVHDDVAIGNARFKGAPVAGRSSSGVASRGPTDGAVMPRQQDAAARPRRPMTQWLTC